MVLTARAEGPGAQRLKALGIVLAIHLVGSCVGREAEGLRSLASQPTHQLPAPSAWPVRTHHTHEDQELGAERLAVGSREAAHLLPRSLRDKVWAAENRLGAQWVGFGAGGAGAEGLGLKGRENQGLREWEGAEDGGLGASEAEGLRAKVCNKHRDCDWGDFCQSGSLKCGACENCRTNGDSYNGRCPVDRCPGTPTSGMPDPSPPTLSWLQLSPTEVDVTQDGNSKRHYVEVYMYIKDIGSGFKMAELTFTSSSESSGIRTYSYGSSDKQQGGENAGVFKAKFWFENYDEGGLWGLKRLWLQDYDSNSRTYEAKHLYLFQDMVNSTIEVVSNTYVPCIAARHITCHERAARCYDKEQRIGGAIYGQCRCNTGFRGDNFACYSNDFLEEEWDGTKPEGNIQLAERQDEVADEEDSRFPEEDEGETPWTDPGTETSNEDGGTENVAEDELNYADREYNPYENQREPTAAKENGGKSGDIDSDEEESGEWGLADSRTIAIIISLCVVVGLVLVALRSYKLSIKLLVVQRRNNHRRIAPTRGRHPSSSEARFQQTQRTDVALRNLAWRHDMSGNLGRSSSARMNWEDNATYQEESQRWNGNTNMSRSLPNVLSSSEGSNRAAFGRTGSTNRNNSRRELLGRRARSDDVELGHVQDFDGEEQAIQESLALQRNDSGHTGSSFLFFGSSGPPQEPAPVSLPAHMARNASGHRPTSSASNQREDVPEGQECAICMEARKGAVLKPCGHNDLCHGCAEHLLQTSKQCPICRADIRGIKRAGNGGNRRGFFGRRR